MRKIIGKYFVNVFSFKNCIDVYKNRHKHTEHIVLQSVKNCL
jgi:hypothetical protein